MLGVVSEIFYLKVILALDLCLFLDLEHFHFMLVHSLRLRGSSSIGLG